MPLQAPVFPKNFPGNFPGTGYSAYKPEPIRHTKLGYAEVIIGAMIYAWVAFFLIVAVIALAPPAGRKILLTGLWVILALAVPASILYEIFR